MLIVHNLLYGVPFVSKRFFSVNLRYSCHDSLFAATIVFSRRRFSFRGDDSLFVATNRYGVPFVSKRFFSRIPRCDMFFQATNRKRGDE